VPLEHNLYKITPINETFGAIITGVDYTQPEKISAEVKAAIMSDTHKYRLLIFRNNGEHMSGDAQVELSGWFG